jgi:hypothetical protein
MRKINFLILLIIITSCSIERADFSHINNEGLFLYKSNDSTILKVTPRLWNHGCTNTSVGMLIEYYDDLGYSLMDDLEDIVSKQHINYYAYPKDNSLKLISDSSILEIPPQNCLADFLKTSWYKNNCFYGVTLWENIIPGLENYLEFKNPYHRLEYSNVTNFDFYINTIDKGRPVFMSIRLPSGGHTVLGIGYNKTDSSFYCYDTWSTSIRKVEWYSMEDYFNHRFISEDTWIITGTLEIIL